MVAFIQGRTGHSGIWAIVMGRFDHNMAGLKNGESNSKPTLKK